MGQYDFFGSEANLDMVSKLGDFLPKVKAAIDWELFRALIEKAIHKDRSLGGRPPYDAVFMFKIVMLQQFYNLSDLATERNIYDKLSFMRFLDLQMGERVPDTNTIWSFKQKLDAVDLMPKLNALFTAMLEAQGLIQYEKGSIIDASFVDIPIRHTTKEDDERLKKGEPLVDLPAKCDERLEKGEIKSAEHVKAQMDLDARHALKGTEHHFGNKLHTIVDAASKLIILILITPASMHDSKALPLMLNGKIRNLKADSAYTGKKYLEDLHMRWPDLTIEACGKGYRNTPLTDEQKLANRKISTIRIRIEHVYGYMTRFMGGMNTRCHGIIRNTREITAKVLAYNMRRYTFLTNAAA